MTEENSTPADRRRERWIASAILCALVLWRTSVFLLWPQSYFDSDQAVFGLMAKHLSELRAVPVFMYGQSYILAVEAWMAAPLFVLLGVSGTVLKLPLVVVNLAVVLLLLRLLEREAGLRPLLAAVPILFFALPAPGTSAFLLGSSGGNLEPFLYVLLVWITRLRPNVCGLIIGIGFLHRKFTIYGLMAVLFMEAAGRTLFTREGMVRRLRMLRTAAEVCIVVQFLKQYASATGPGTSIADLYSAPNNLQELINRTCVDPRTLAAGVGRLMTAHWPQLFGAVVAPLNEFSIESTVSQGVPAGWLLFGATLLLALAGTLWGLARGGRWRSDYAFCTYLILVGGLSMAGYVAGRCGNIAPPTMRYELLSIIGAVGLGAMSLIAAPSRQLRTAWITLAIACTAVAASGHARLSFEYATNRPIGEKELLVRQLQARGIRYGYADYWVAYYVSFVTKENVILTSTDFVRVKSYEPIVAANKDQAVRITRQPCEDGRHLTQYFFVCPP
jgi:hypothetical protein